MADEMQGEEAGSAVATQEPTVSEEVLDRWDALGEETTPETPAESGSEAKATTTAKATPGQEPPLAGEAPATPVAAASPITWTATPQQLHALQRAGLKIEELQALPDKGKGVAEKLEQSWRDLGGRWAQLGAAQGAQGNSSPATNAAAQAAAIPATASPAAPVAAAQAEAGIDFGIDPKVWGDDGAKAMTAVLQKAVTPFMERISRLESQARRREDDALRQQVTGKFDAWSKDYGDYGDVKGDHSKLTPAQIEARQKVLVLADRIMVGAAADGVQLPTDDALAYAHEAITAEFRVQNQRQTIAAQVTNRKKQFVTRPVSRTTTAQVNPEESAAATWEEGMKALEAA